MIDLGHTTGMVNHLWDTHGGWIIAGGVAVTIAFVTLSLLAWWRSADRARVLSRITALVVLAWTSEGLWEVARHTLNLPVAFAAVTFFVFEAMMVTAAMQAERHRVRYGSPGPTGQYVWVIAALTATIVGLNSASLVEAALRMSLPLAATGLWWTIAMRAPRDTDTPEIVAARQAAKAARAATWTITPSTVLVWLGLRRPGKQTPTEAEQERLRRRMVVAADRLAGAKHGTVAARRTSARLRRLSRQATPEDIAWVRAQVAMTTRIVDLVLPARGNGDQLPVLPPVASPKPAPVTAPRATVEPEPTPADTTPAEDSSKTANSGEPTVPAPKPATAKPARGSRGGERQRYLDQAVAILAQNPATTGADLAARFGLKPRTARNLRQDAVAVLAASGQWLDAGKAGGDGAAAPVAAPTAVETASPNGHAAVPPAKVAAFAAAATGGGGAA